MTATITTYADLSKAQLEAAIQKVTGKPAKCASRDAAIKRLSREAGAAGMTPAEVLSALDAGIPPAMMAEATEISERMLAEEEANRAPEGWDVLDQANRDGDRAQEEAAAQPTDDARIAAFEERTMAERTKAKTPARKKGAAAAARKPRAEKAPRRQPKEKAPAKVKVAHPTDRPRAGTTAARIFDEMMKPGGTTNADLCALTGWKCMFRGDAARFAQRYGLTAVVTGKGATTRYILTQG